MHRKKMWVALFYFCCKEAALEVPKKVCGSVQETETMWTEYSLKVWGLRYLIWAVTVSVLFSCAEAALEGLQKSVRLSVHKSLFIELTKWTEHSLSLKVWGLRYFIWAVSVSVSAQSDTLLGLIRKYVNHRPVLTAQHGSNNRKYFQCFSILMIIFIFYISLTF